MLKALMSLIVAALLALAGPAFAADKDGKAPAKSAAAQQSVPDSEKLDLNTASEDDLTKLPGIGAVRAKAIIKHRPYKAKDELVGRKVITASVYEQIKERVIARQAK